MAEALERVPMEQVSGFILEATLREKHLLELMDQAIETYEPRLIADEQIHSLRIAKCHAQLLGLLDCLGPEGLGLFSAPVIDQAAGLVWRVARERQQAINADHPLVAEFWEAFDYIEGLRVDPTLNHYGDGTGYITINLKEFERYCGEHKLNN